MNLRDLIAQIDDKSLRNEALQLLTDIIVDMDDRLEDALARVIDDPASIQNTNRFASLLADWPSDKYIPRLIAAIATATPGDTPWLMDYMYALGELLELSMKSGTGPWPADEDFVHLMGRWLLSTGGGECSWKAGVILMSLNNPSARIYLVHGAADAGLFHQTRIACIRGVVNHFREDAPELLQRLHDDPEPLVRDEASRALKWLQDQPPDR